MLCVLFLGAFHLRCCNSKVLMIIYLLRKNCVICVFHRRMPMEMQRQFLQACAAAGCAARICAIARTHTLTALKSDKEVIRSCCMLMLPFTPAGAPEHTLLQACIRSLA